MLTREQLIDLTEATRLFPQRPHVSTLYRWCTKGVRGVRLDHIRAGRRIYTSVEAVERFCRALAESNRANDPRPAKPETGPPPVARQHGASASERRIKAARDRLAAHGIRVDKE